MKKGILLIIGIIWFQYSFSQENSSIKELTKMKKDTTKIHLLNKLAWKNRNNDSIARLYALEAEKISDSISYDKGLSVSFMRLGVLEKNKKNYEKAIKYYLKSLAIEKENKNAYGIIRAKVQLGKIHQRTRNYETALKYTNEALAICSVLENEKLKASIYATIASIYFDLNLFPLSLESYLESIVISKKLNDEKNLAKSYLNIGVLYNKLKQKEKALPYIKKSQLIYEKLNKQSHLSKVYTGLGVNYEIRKELDSALFYYKKSLHIKNKLGLKNKEAIFNNLGVVYEKKELFNLAEENYNKSILLALKENNELQLLDTYLNMGVLNRKKNLNYKALEYFEKSNLLANKYNKDLDRLSILMGIAEAYEHINDFKKASLYNEKHIILRNSIDTKYREIEAIESKYRREREKNNILLKEQEIYKEKSTRIIAESERKTTQLYALIGAVIFLILLFFAIFYVFKHKKGKELAEKNQKIEVQKNIELLKKQELKSIKAMINGQQNERKRIAQDLHDRLGSMLSMVKLNYKSIEDNLDKLKEENKKQYSQANALLDEACDAVREIAHNMVSGVLTKFGLVAALEDLKNTLKGTNTFQLDIITHGLNDRLENTLEVELYGIIQELIHNVIKHAQAKDVTVQLLKRIDGINLTVIDDGIGFEDSKEVLEHGIGLKGVASRVDELRGSFNIDSGKGNGSTINIDIPLQTF